MNSVVKPIIDMSVRGLCVKSYPNHPKGCPNWGKKKNCPPKVPKFHEMFDDTKDIYAIWTTFPFGQHVKKMKKLHPEWSERQLNCCLYWQGTARRNLKGEIIKFKKGHPDLFITTCPEAIGVNVTETMKGIGEHLEWPPKTKTYQVALAGVKIK